MNSPETPGVEVPWEALPPETLRRVLEEFVTREGTDYGETAFTLDEKVAHVARQLQRREAVLTFDPDTETIALAVRRGRLDRPSRQRSNQRWNQYCWRTVRKPLAS